MRIIAFIEEDAVIRKILTHLNKWLPQYHDPPHDPPDSQDSSENNNVSATLNAYLLTIKDNKAPENTQLNMFSDRSYEWWEVGNRLNLDAESQVCYGTAIRNLNDNGVTKNNKQRLKLQTNNAYEGNHSAYSNVDYQHPFDDEFSQEVFYED